MARYQHIDASPRFIAVDLERQLLPGAFEHACREHITFIALSGDSAPHFTTCASFVSTPGEEIAPLFGQVLHLCDRQGLIGREMFAIDGVKLPSNAAKARSGTRADFEQPPPPRPCSPATGPTTPCRSSPIWPGKKRAASTA